MRRTIVLLSVALCFLAVTSCSRGTESIEAPIITQAELDSIVVKHPMFSGSIVISQGAETIASIHTGYADRETEELNDARTLHSVASVGKMFTAVAIAQLVESGRLAYDAAVIDVVPELDKQISASVTIDHLLTHTSGMERISGVDDATLDALRSNTDYFALIISKGIGSDGPEDFSYRNENFHILGEIIERKSGQSYESYIRENIAEPASMTGPIFDRSDRANTNKIATPYLAVDFETWWNSEDSLVANNVDEFVHVAPLATPAAGGGSYATALDMIRFATAIRTGILISQKSFKEMCAPFSANSSAPRTYARGCSVSAGAEGMRIGHTGSTAGIQARFYLYWERGVDVIVLSNHDEQAAPIFRDIDAIIEGD